MRTASNCWLRLESHKGDGGGPLRASRVNRSTKVSNKRYLLSITTALSGSAKVSRKFPTLTPRSVECLFPKGIRYIGRSWTGMEEDAIIRI